MPKRKCRGFAVRFTALRFAGRHARMAGRCALAAARMLACWAMAHRPSHVIIIIMSGRCLAPPPAPPPLRYVPRARLAARVGSARRLCRAVCVSVTCVIFVCGGVSCTALGDFIFRQRSSRTTPFLSIILSFSRIKGISRERPRPTFHLLRRNARRGRAGAAAARRDRWTFESKDAPCS